MITIALQNLKLLISDEETFKNNYLIGEGNQLSLIQKDNFEMVDAFKVLEYPIYFTYNQVLNSISDDSSMSYQQRKQLLILIDESLDNVYEIIDGYKKDKKEEDEEEENDKVVLYEILKNIEDRYEIVREKTIMNHCEWLSITFDSLIEAFQETSRYLYVTPFKEIKESSTQVEEEPNKETEEVNPNLVYEDKKDN